MIILAFAIVYIVWGSTYFFIAKAIHGFPPLMLGALRFLAAGVLLLVWARFRGEKLPRLNDLKNAAIAGLLLLFIGNGVVIWVEQYMASAMVAIMVSSTPLWFVLLDKPKWKENFKNTATITGLVVGFVGVIILFSENIFGAFSSISGLKELSGLVLLLIGSIAWAGGSLFSKYKGSNGSAAMNTAVQMIFAGIAFFTGSLIRGEPGGMDWSAISGEAWASLLYLVFFGSIAGYSAYVWLLKVRSATQVSTHAYVNPVVAVLLGVFFANEQISALQITGLLVILGSVLILNLGNYRKARAISAANSGSEKTGRQRVRLIKKRVRSSATEAEL